MRFLQLLLILFSIIMVGCSFNNTQKRVEVAQCKQMCSQRFTYCKTKCVENCCYCTWHATNQAKEKYSRYLRECEVQGKKSIRELNSFRDPLQCCKMTCDCATDFMLCKNSCS